MDKTKIEWCDSTWNPVTGCNHNCEYCYARGIAPQGKKQPYPFGFTPTLHRYSLGKYEKKAGRTIFVCSMADLFGSWVPDSWIEEVFAACEKAPQHKYLFLTKNPQRYADLDWADKLPIRDNMWYGTSVTNGAQMEQAADAFGELQGNTKTFFSIEPILEDIAASKGWAIADNGSYAKWIILGAETGRRKEKVTPEREWIKKIADDCDEGGIPLFREHGLRRELPRELRGVSA